MHPPLRHVRAGLLAAAAVVALSLVACGESAGEAAAEAALVAAGAGDVEIDDDGGTVSYRTEQGQVTITGGDAAALPRDFPDDVYLPGDYVVESTLAMEQDLFIALAVQEDVPRHTARARLERDDGRAREQRERPDELRKGGPRRGALARPRRRRDDHGTSAHAGLAVVPARKSPITPPTAADWSMCRWWPPARRTSRMSRGTAARSLRSGSGK